MAQWSDIEQLMLELVNRARLDPLGEAARFGIALNQGLAPGTLSATAKQPLAPNGLLNDAARSHSQWMLETDTFSHTGVGGSDPGDRMVSAGYAFTGAWTWGENIAWQGTTGSFSPASYIVDEHQNLFLSPGHRENILNGSFREIGIGALSGEISGYNALMATQAFATTGSAVFVTGVIYADSNGDDFYGVGEARSGVGVAATTGNAAGSTVSAAAGGYAIAVGAGLATVTFSGGGLAAAITVSVDARAGNAKVDLVDGLRIDTSASTTLGANAGEARLLGAGPADLTGNAAANLLHGNQAKNQLCGYGGNDSLSGAPGNDWLWGGNGNDSLNGGSGSDGLYGQAGNDTLGAAGGNDTLNGGDGSDQIWSGPGQDVFVFNTMPGATNADRLHDYSPADDQLQLDDAVFTGLVGSGVLAASAFLAGSAAATASHRIIHDRASGALYFDSDGAGGAAQIRFATLAANLTLTVADFEII